MEVLKDILGQLEKQVTFFLGLQEKAETEFEYRTLNKIADHCTAAQREVDSAIFQLKFIYKETPTK